MQRITSRRNPKVRWARALQRSAKARRAAGAWVVEGVRLAEEVQRAGARPLAVFAVEGLAARGWALAQAWDAQGVPVYVVSPAVMDALRATQTPPGLVVVAPRPQRPWPPRPDWVLVLDRLQDPGNVGALLRTAWAAGVPAVALVTPTVDPWGPKVARAAMGAHWHVALWEGSWAALRPRLQGLRVYAADAQGALPFTVLDGRGPVALVVGSEAHGLSPEARAAAHQRVHIPMPGGAESLNAAVAGALLMYEVLRQRGWAARGR